MSDWERDFTFPPSDDDDDPLPHWPPSGGPPPDPPKETREPEERPHPMRVPSVYEELLQSPWFAGGCVRTITNTALRTVCRLARIHLSRDDCRRRSRIKRELERHAESFRERCGQDRAFVWTVRMLVTWQALPTLLAHDKRPGSRNPAAGQAHTEGIL
jgi:hypothetical protein